MQINGLFLNRCKIDLTRKRENKSSNPNLRSNLMKMKVPEKENIKINEKLHFSVQRMENWMCFNFAIQTSTLYVEINNSVFLVI